MSVIFDALPGMEVPVGGIDKALAEMWSAAVTTDGDNKKAQTARAIQANFVLHLGHGTSIEDAKEQFHVAAKFSLRCPSRVVVLCPQRADSGVAEIKAKAHVECYPGKSKSDRRCCEFVMLSYSRAARPFLESQVSISLSSDLPLYYWPHRFTDSAKLADYLYLLTRASRIMIDSGIAPEDAMTYAWPKRENVRDLVHSRMLPARQTIGQFLSQYPVELIAEGVKSVTVAHGSALAPEGRVLLEWVQRRLPKCGVDEVEYRLVAPAEAAPRSLKLSFEYTDKKSFTWVADYATGSADFTADFGSGVREMPTGISLLAPEAALSEAMFF